MANLRTTVILKTDIVDSTPRTARQTQSEMSLQRKQHKRFISEIVTKNAGMIFQEEGDAFLIEFPSVTTAALAAIEMHQSLLYTSANGPNGIECSRLEKYGIVFRRYNPCPRDVRISWVIYVV
jgi:class 3 adenylate cyclase